MIGVEQMSDKKDTLGIATMPQAMDFTGVKSRTTMLEWEREGVFPSRVQLHGGRIGYRWSELLTWRDELGCAEISQDDYSELEKQAVHCARVRLVELTYPRGVPANEKSGCEAVRSFLNAHTKSHELVLWMRRTGYGK